MDRLIVRAASLADLAAAESLARAAFEELRRFYRPKDSAPATSSGLRLVAEVDGRLVGTVLYEIESDHVHLRGLAVDSRYRRLGVARSLVEHLSGLATAAELPALSLYTIKQTGNVAVFERLGFRTVHEEAASWATRDNGEQPIDVTMQKPVS